MVGKFKDDQLQDHRHPTGIIGPVALGSGGADGMREVDSQTVQQTRGVSGARKSNTTHGKQKGVKFIIKVL